MEESIGIEWERVYARNWERHGKEPSKELMKDTEKELCRNCKVNGMKFMEETENGI